MIIKLLSTLKKFALPLVIAYTLLITVLSLATLHYVPTIGSNFDDKIYHAIAYMVFVFLVFNYLQTKRTKNAIWIAMIVCFVYGTILEVLQKVLNIERTFDTFDIIANLVGVIIGCVIVKYLYKVRLN